MPKGKYSRPANRSMKKQLGIGKYRGQTRNKSFQDLDASADYRAGYKSTPRKKIGPGSYGGPMTVEGAFARRQAGGTADKRIADRMRRGRSFGVKRKK